MEDKRKNGERKKMRENERRETMEKTRKIGEKKKGKTNKYN